MENANAATAAPTVIEQSNGSDVNDNSSWTPQERQEWIEKGTVPKGLFAEPKETAPATESVKTEEAPTEETKQQEPAEEPKTEAPKNRDEKRLGSIREQFNAALKERKEETERVARLREEREALENRIAALKRAPVSPPAPAELKPPDPGKYEATEQGWAEYSRDRDAYYEKLAESKADKKAREVLAEYDRQQQAKAAEAQARARHEDSLAKWNKNTAAFLKENPQVKDFTKVANELYATGLIGEGSLIDTYIPDSEHGPALLYHLALNPDEALRIVDAAEKSPLGAIRMLVELEHQLAGPAKQNSPQGQPARRTTNAPPPPEQVSGIAADTTNELEAALRKAEETGDVTDYNRIMTAREIAAFKKRG